MSLSGMSVSQKLFVAMAFDPMDHILVELIQASLDLDDWASTLYGTSRKNRPRIFEELCMVAYDCQRATGGCDEVSPLNKRK